MREPLPNITGILLAGGQSSRMGRDKGMIRIGKFLMYQYPLKVLESLCDEILISTCNPMEIEEDYEQVCDEIPGIGPIGGVVTCLEKSSNDLNIILSYDLPLVNRDLFTELLKYSGDPAWSAADSAPNNDVSSPKSDMKLTGESLPDRNETFPEGSSKNSNHYNLILPAASPNRPEPLCGIYRKSTIPVLYQMIDQGIFAMHKLIPQVRAKILAVGAEDPFYHDRLFKNINTESDLSGLPEHLL
jgi:molybdopterin-guanine dinucleotide biosynthesis protein A